MNYFTFFILLLLVAGVGYAIYEVIIKPIFQKESLSIKDNPNEATITTNFEEEK